MIVPYPNLWPNRCLNCTSQKGPCWFGGTHGVQEEAVYLCRTCAETIGVEFGFVEGEEMAKLREAAEEIERYRKEAEAHAQAVVEAAQQIEDFRRQLAAAKLDAEEARAELATMEHQVADVRDVARRLGKVDPVEARADKLLDAYVETRE